MNEVMNQICVRNRFKDFRRKKALEWFNENYFVALYDYLDNYVTQFEDVESTANAFNIPVKKVLYLIRTDSYIVLNNHKYKMYLVRKEKIEEHVRRR